MPKITYGECTFCGDGSGELGELPAQGQHIYIYVDGKITQVGFICSHCLVHHGLR